MATIEDNANGINGSSDPVPQVSINDTDASGSAAGPSESIAEQLARKHADAAHAHNVTIEDVPDEEDLAHPGSKSAIATGTATPIIDGPPLQGKKNAQAFDINSNDLFPALGASGPGKGKGRGGAAPVWGAKASNGDSSAPVPSPKPSGTTTRSIPNRNVTETMQYEGNKLTPQKDLKKPFNEIIKDIMKATGTRIQASRSSNDILTVLLTGEIEAAAKAKRLLANQIAKKAEVKFTIPLSTRKHIIGAKGATIQRISAQTGVKIQIPQVEETEVQTDDPFAEDEQTVEVTLNGDADGIALAQREIQTIIGQKTSHVNVKLPLDKFPGHYFPFLAGPHNKHVNELEEGNDLKIRIPSYYMSDSSTSFSPAPFPITISGEKAAVLNARTQFERQVAELANAFSQMSVPVDKGKHRFLLGEKAKPMHDILEESGCSVILPPQHVNMGNVLVIGPKQKLGDGVKSVLEKANAIRYHGLDISKAYPKEFQGDSAAQRQHARDLARYFRKKKEIQRIETEHSVQIMLPKPEILYDPATGVLLEIVGEQQANVDQARQSIVQLVNNHPPSRLGYVDIEPLLHRHIIGSKGRNLQKIKDDHAVEVLFADEDDQDSQVVLVYEGSEGPGTSADTMDAAAAIKAVIELLEKTASEQADLKTKVLTIPSKYHAKIIGPKGTTLNMLTGGQDSPVRVIMGAPKLKPGQPALGPKEAQAADDSITVRGPSADVDRISNKITEFVEKYKHEEVLNSYTTTFEFPQKFQKNLVGKGGSNISKYREELGVQIDLEGNNVTIKGVKPNVEEAKTRILSLAKKLEDETSISMTVAPEWHRTIIGQGGKFVHRLEDKYHVRIQFPKQNQPDASEVASDAGAVPQKSQAPNEIILRGPSKGVKDAKDEITELLKYEQEHSHSNTITIPARVLPHIIGAHGKVINQIRDESGAKIDLPPQGSTDAEEVEVKIKGTKEQVAKAKAAILANSKEVENQVVKHLEVEKKYHRALIGPGGSTLHGIVVKSGGPTDKSAQARMVRFPHSDVTDHKIKVEGAADVVDKIIKELEAIIEAEKSKTTIVVDVPPEKHRKLIGREGAVRKEIESKFNVTVDIPRQRQDGGEVSSGVKVSGSADDVEKAKEHILSLTKDQDATTVQVPKHLHHPILDNGSLARTFRNRYNVDLGFSGDLPPKPKAHSRKRGDAMPLITDEPSEADISWEVIDHTEASDGSEVTWNLRGATEGINSAKAELERLIANETSKTTTGYLFLPDPSKYRYVVGPGGSQVNSIRKDTGCKVTIPKEQSDEAIVIQGSKEGVEKAKEIIVELVQSGGSGSRSPGGNGGKGRRRGNAD